MKKISESYRIIYIYLISEIASKMFIFLIRNEEINKHTHAHASYYFCGKKRQMVNKQ